MAILASTSLEGITIGLQEILFTPKIQEIELRFTECTLSIDPKVYGEITPQSMNSGIVFADGIIEIKSEQERIEIMIFGFGDNIIEKFIETHVDDIKSSLATHFDSDYDIAIYHN